MITVSLGEHTIAVAFSLVPLTFIDVFRRVDHTALALWQSIDPVSVVSVSILVEEGASSMLLILVPVSRVLTAQLIPFVLPVSALAVALVHSPHALILILILVELNAEAFFAVVAPISNILLTGLPDLTLDSSILLLVLLIDPVD